MVVVVVVDTRILISDDTSSAVGRVRLAGTIEASAGVAHGRRYPSYAIVYLVAGSGHFADELGTSRRVTAGDLLLVFPEVEHTYGPVGDRDWSEVYVVFDGPVFDLWQSSGLLDPRRPVHRLEPIAHWLRQLRAFLDHPRPQTTRERELEVCRFLTLVTSMLERSERPATWLERAQGLLSAGLGERQDLRAVAAELDVGYEAFRKRFRRESGVSPAAYRATRRLEVARELLCSTSMSHREIASSVGFGDEFHFSKRFKQWAGVPPREARRAAGITDVAS